MENQQVPISLDQTEGIVCEECQNTYFTEALVIRKASGLLVGSSKPSYIPIPVFQCTMCGHVNSDFLPKELKNLEKE